MDFDGSYHRLFSNPKMVEDLFLHFVEEDWVSELDFSTLTRFNAKFHSAGLKRREGDLVFRVRMKSGQETYLFLLLEFQSREDHWMALRVLIYVALLYDQLLRENQLPDEHLPPVFPLVLYNGSRRWRAPVRMSQLIDLKGHSKLRKYQPSIQYYLVDESRFPLGKPGSLSGTLFRFEQLRVPGQLDEALAELIELLKAPDFRELTRDFGTYLRHILEPRLQLELPLERVEHFVKVKRMLKENMEKWERGFYQDGLDKGWVKGEAHLFARLLEKRFGPLGDEIIARINQASKEEIERWGLNIFDAETLEEVFL